MPSIALNRPADTSHARGLVGHAVARPLLDGGGERVVQRLLGEIEIAEQADQRGEDAARLGAIDGVHHLAHAIVVTVAHRQIIVRDTRNRQHRQPAVILRLNWVTDASLSLQPPPQVHRPLPAAHCPRFTMRHEVPRRRMSAATASSPIEFLLNGRAVRVDAPSPQMTLLDFLRAAGLTGAKEGCAEGECGACAVAHGRAARRRRSAYRVVNSCLMFLPMAAGHEIYTVEALAADGELRRAQQAMAAAGGSQCGYCTPGFVMSLFAEQYRPDRAGPCDPLALAGNLCRCTGYRPIRDAALSLGPAPAGALPRAARAAGAGARRRSTPTASRGRPRSTTASRSSRDDPDATLIAGGTDLGVESNLRGRRWPHLVSVEAIDELRECSRDAASASGSARRCR